MATIQGRTFARFKSLLPASLRDAMELFLTRNTILKTSGWSLSRKTSLPIDAAGDPLPWFTYPAIGFLGPRLTKEMRVFEYGAGNSTLWWARRVKSVKSVENLPEWFARISANAPKNATILLREGDDYSLCDGRLDIIVIDGKRRTECARAAIPCLSEGGVIVWDNSDPGSCGEGDLDGIAFLERAGFKRLDFWGFGPLLTFEWCASVFYRDGNCFGI